MFDRILGRALVDTGKLTREQLKEVMEAQESIRVKLGVIAVSEKLMSIEQADEINALQASVDRRFGDLAVEKGYLTNEQVKRMLSLQGNEYLIFIQTLIDKNFMNMKQIEEAVLEYQKANGFMASEMDALKSGEIERIVPLFLTMEDKLYRGLYSIGVKCVYRLVDSHVSIGKSYQVDEVKAEVLGYQKLVGMHRVFAGVTGAPESIKKMALAYTKEDIIDTREDALDAVCELINCANGIFATELSRDRIMVDMEPPVYSGSYQTVSGGGLYVLPMTVCGEEISYILSIDQDVTVR